MSASVQNITLEIKSSYNKDRYENTGFDVSKTSIEEDCNYDEITVSGSHGNETNDYDSLRKTHGNEIIDYDTLTKTHGNETVDYDTLRKTHGNATVDYDSLRKTHGDIKKNVNENVNDRKSEKLETKDSNNRDSQNHQFEHLTYTSQTNHDRKWKMLFVISLIICLGLTCALVSVSVLKSSAQDIPCTRGPCLNGGQCFTAGDDYACACPRGFYGPQCENTPCSDQPCFNNGSCTVRQHTFSCSCLEGFAGTYCQANSIDECSDITDGVYMLSPAGLEVKVEALCDLHTDGHNWTVIQRRFNGSLDFYKNWTSYEHGFGSAYGEYYIGNKVIRAITSQGRHVLRVIMTDFAGVQRYAEYSYFSIGDSSSQYQLSCTGYSGNAGDSLASEHGGYKFYTYDKDNSRGCAKLYHGAWWYNSCHRSNLNGKYHQGGSSPHGIGINWYSFRGYNYSMKSTVMMIRRA